MKILDITANASNIKEAMQILQNKTISVPAWSGNDGLKSEYDPTMHPVMNKTSYPDIVTKEGTQAVTRVTFNLQQLAVKRMTELISGVPVKRVYNAENTQQNKVATYLEKIYQNARIDSVNIERLNMLYAGCEVVTLWYATQKEHDTYGFHSQLKLRCRNFSPMLGDMLYPLFDEYGDMIAMSVAYTRKVNNRDISFLDAYSDEQHIKYSNEGGEWAIVEDEVLTLGKIPAIYVYRPTPIWEDTSKSVYEIEWALSRNGNYLRENSKPLFCVFSDEVIRYGDEGSPNDARAVIQYPKGSSANYITWTQAVDNLKFYVEQLRSLFFTQLQLPDWSYEKMSQHALSGESRKQMFIDAQLKVKDESGRLIEFFDREMNVIKAFLKAMLPENMAKHVDTLPVEIQITPFTITDETDTINRLILANGGEPIISQRESIEQLGWSVDVDKTLQEIKAQGAEDIFTSGTPELKEDEDEEQEDKE